ncbi:MAG: winged helix-turn-helix transcriptional regulator [Acidimicrobiales bacterium]
MAEIFPDDEPAPCDAIEQVMQILGRAWAGAVLRAILDGHDRFSAVARAVPGASDSVLTTRLRELCRRGLAERIVEAGPPVVIRYTPTPAGRDAAPILAEIEAFARAHPEVVAGDR